MRTEAEWRQRREWWRWARFAVAEGRSFWGWGWLLLPWALPWGCYLTINASGDVEA